MSRGFYLISAILGTIIPWFFFSNFIVTHGMDIPLFLSSLFSNSVSSGFTADLLISSFIFWFWVYFDAKQNNVNRWWIIIPANLLVGLSLALPLYFYMRAGKQQS